jgi:hypothetical protein
MFKDLKAGTVVSVKLNSGEELITRVNKVFDTHLEISEPVSVAPGPQGMGLVPSLFTSDTKGLFMLNTSSIALIAETEYNIKAKYSEAVSGVKVPEKKIVLG